MSLKENMSASERPNNVKSKVSKLLMTAGVLLAPLVGKSQQVSNNYECYTLTHKDSVSKVLTDTCSGTNGYYNVVAHPEKLDGDWLLDYEEYGKTKTDSTENDTTFIIRNDGDTAIIEYITKTNTGESIVTFDMSDKEERKKEKKYRKQFPLTQEEEDNIYFNYDSYWEKNLKNKQ